MESVKIRTHNEEYVCYTLIPCKHTSNMKRKKNEYLY